MSEPRPHSRFPLAAVAFLAAICVGAGLRFASLSEPLWLDELHTSWCVVDSIGDVAKRAKMGNQSPLFFWIDYLSFHALGQDEFALRFPSLLASLALLVSIPWIVYRLSGSLLGSFLATFLAAIDDQFLFYAVEARPYAMVQLVAVWQVYFFLKAMFPDRHGRESGHQTNWPYPMWWSVASVILFYLHLTTIALIATQWLVSIAVFLIDRTRSLSRCRSWIAASFVLALTMLPGFLQLMPMNEYKAIWNAVVETDRYGLMMIAHLSVYLLTIMLVSLFWGRRTTSRNEIMSVVAMLSLVILPILFCFFGSASQQVPLAHYRFTIASSTVLILTAGVAISLLRNQRQLKIVAILLTGALAVVTNPLLASWAQTGAWPQQRQEQWAEVVQRIGKNREPVVLCPNLVEDVWVDTTAEQPWRSYYEFPLRGIYWSKPQSRQIWPAPIRGGQAKLSDDVLASLAEHLLAAPGSSFWLVVRAWPGDAEEIAENLRLSIQGNPNEAHDDTPCETIFRRVTNAPVNLFEYRVKKTPPFDSIDQVPQ